MTAFKALEARIAPEAFRDPPACGDPGFRLEPTPQPAVQDELINWIISDHRDAQTKPVKWVVGPAGAGKTAILGSVARDCQKKNLLAATFSFSSDLTGAKTTLIPTLAYQLIEHPSLSHLKPSILSAIEQYPSVFDSTIENQLESLILTPLRHEPQHDRSTWPRVIIIDGLGECRAKERGGDGSIASLTNDSDQNKILRAIFTAIADSTFPFKIILASRPDPTIRQFFEGPARDFTDELDLDNIQSSEEAITLFLETKFEQIRRTHSINASWPPRHAAARLTANGSAARFVYATTIMRCIEESPLGPQKALQAILESVPTIGSKTPHPFSQLDALYASILQFSPNPSKAATWLSLIRSLNHERYCSGPEQSFSAFVINHFLESAPGEADDLLQNLRSLVKIPASEDKTTPYSFYHKTLFEFLEDVNRSGPLYVSFVHRHELYTAKYLEVCKNKGFPHASPAEQDTLLDYFVEMDPFFEGSLLYSGDEHLQCDADWWVKLFIAKRKPNKIRMAFLWAHKKCSWYHCTPTCSLWRNSVVRCCASVGWAVPTKVWLLRDRFRHHTQLGGKYFSPAETRIAGGK